MLENLNVLVIIGVGATMVVVMGAAAGWLLGRRGGYATGLKHGREESDWLNERLNRFGGKRN